jgi:hypothetical protein
MENWTEEWEFRILLVLFSGIPWLASFSPVQQITGIYGYFMLKISLPQQRKGGIKWERPSFLW